VPYSNINLGQLRALLDNQLGQSAPALWRTDEKNKILQDTLRWWNILTGYWKGPFTITTTASAPWYALPAPLAGLSTIRVEFQSRSLRPATRYDMDHGRDGWEAETTASGGDVPTKPKYYVIGGTNLLGIWPADAAGNSALVVNSILTTPTPTLDSDAIDLAPELIDPLLSGAQALAVFKEGGVEAKLAGPLFTKFIEAAGDQCAVFKASAAYRRYMGIDYGRAKMPYRLPAAQIGAR